MSCGLVFDKICDLVFDKICDLVFDKICDLVFAKICGGTLRQLTQSPVFQDCYKGPTPVV